jgi:hypothetical protein
MSAVKDPITREVIASSLGAQWNDRVVQVFTTLAELRSGTYVGWAPIRGSLAYAEDARTLYECVSFDTSALPVWWPVGGRGAIAHYPSVSHLSSPTVTLPGSGVITTIVKLAGEVRYGRSYGFAWGASIYTPSGNLGLWCGEVFAQPTAQPGVAIGALLPYGHIRLAGNGWAAGVFSSQEMAGYSVIGPMAATYADAEFVWRGWAYPGTVDLAVNAPVLSIVEMGATP